MKTTQLYMIRHGQSQGNKSNSFLGHTDLDLTELGHIQAENTAQFLKDIKAHVIYSSDLSRAYNTAMHTAKLKGMEIIKSKNLREIYAGQWENKRFDDLEKEFNQSYTVWMTNIGRVRCDGGESTEELQNRIVSEITRIAEENEGKTVFVFTHATPIRAFKAFCDGKTLDEMKDVPWTTNASVSHFEYSEGKFKVVDYGIDFFQGSEKSTLPANV